MKHYLIKHSDSAVVKIESFSRANANKDDDNKDDDNKETVFDIKKQIAEIQHGNIQDKGTHEYRLLAKINAADVPKVSCGLSVEIKSRVFV